MNVASIDEIDNIKENDIIINKYGKKYLFGPKITKKTYVNSFKKRILSSSICEKDKYKSVNTKTSQILIEKFYKDLKENEILEISKNKIVATHTIIKLPGEIK